jgi:trigger factor
MEKKTKKSTITSALNRHADGTLEITITIPWARVKEKYQKSLKDLAQKVTVKGFRKGKAPLKKAEQKIGRSKIYEQVLKNLATDVYLEAIKQQKIKPVVSPQIKVVSLKEEKDWQIIATTC